MSRRPVSQRVGKMTGAGPRPSGRGFLLRFLAPFRLLIGTRPGNSRHAARSWEVRLRTWSRRGQLLAMLLVTIAVLTGDRRDRTARGRPTRGRAGR